MEIDLRAFSVVNKSWHSLLEILTLLFTSVHVCRIEVIEYKIGSADVYLRNGLPPFQLELVWSWFIKLHSFIVEHEIRSGIIWSKLVLLCLLLLSFLKPFFALKSVLLNIDYQFLYRNTQHNYDVAKHVKKRYGYKRPAKSILHIGIRRVLCKEKQMIRGSQDAKFIQDL